MKIDSHDVLDNPTWFALTTKQQRLGLGSELALRYLPEVAPFSAIKDRSPEAFRDLAQLASQTDFTVLQTRNSFPQIHGLTISQIGIVLQMISTEEPTGHAEETVIRLCEIDVPDMVALTEKTKPGPFGKRTYETGNYVGIRAQGRLIAMAGERMRLDGYTEISAVCVDDAYRGKGLAATLMNFLRYEILRRDETPFLHVFDHNHGAIALYERLGFSVREKFFLYKITCN